MPVWRELIGWGQDVKPTWLTALPRCLIAVVVLTLCTLPVRADAEPASYLRLEGNAMSFPLANHLDFLEDESGSLAVEDIALRNDFHFGVRQGLAPGTIWFRFTVLRSKDVPAQWVLAFGEPDIDDVRVFVPTKNGGFTEISLGRRIPSRELPLAARRHVAMLDLPKGEPATIYLRLASKHKIRFEDASLWQPGALIYEEARDSALFAFNFGILAVIAVISVLFGGWLRDWTLLAYALFVTTVLSGGISHTAIVTLMFPDAGRETNYLLSGISLLGGVAAFIFMWDRILDLRKNFPFVHGVYIFAGVTAAASLFGVSSPAFHVMARGAQIIMLGVSISSIIMAGLRMRQNPKDVVLRFYLFAFFPFALVWVSELGALLFPQIPADLGRLVHGLATPTHLAILSVALAYRLRNLQRQQVRAEIALAGEQLARQRQRTFIDMATHEFKTPLAVIDSAAQMLDLLTAPARPEVFSRIATIRQAVQRQVKLIDTCLAGERHEAQAPKRKKISPATVIEQAIERNCDPDRAPLVAVASPVPATCIADPDLLAIALDALIENARRYGPVDSAVEITVRGENGHIVFLVEDRGPGIPIAEAQHVFEKYYRCAASGAIYGSGIGLHLVKTIAELHGGFVGYRPREGGGASFTLTIPARLDLFG
jgi:two-component system, sensor histidine kinase LadS